MRRKVRRGTKKKKIEKILFCGVEPLLRFFQYERNPKFTTKVDTKDAQSEIFFYKRSGQREFMKLDS